LKTLKDHTRSRLKDERGVAALEFAIVAQLLMLLLYGMLSYGFVFAVDHDITHAAAEGARATLTQPDSSTDAQLDAYATTAARDALSFTQVKQCNSCITSEVIPCPSDATIRCIHVHIDYPYRNQPLVPTVAGMNGLIPQDIVADSTVELDF
jgi:Flp pilus assembly protein TadG